MQMMDDPFGSLPQFGGNSFGGPGGPIGMAGPSGFNGMSGMGDGMFGMDPMKKKKSGFNPAFMMGILPGLMAGGHLSSIAPLFGLAGMLGPKLFK